MPTRSKSAQAWTNWELSLLSRLYPKFDDEEIQKKLPQRTTAAIHSKASNLGLSKAMPEDEEKKEEEVPEQKPVEPQEPEESPEIINLDEVVANLDKLYSEGRNKYLERFANIFEDRLKTKYGIDLKKVGKKLGEGTMGAAYEFQNIVLKATKDLSEAFASANIIGKEVGGVVNIYRVVLFPTREAGKYIFKTNNEHFRARPMAGFMLAFIFLEKLRPLEPKIKKALKKRLKKFEKEMHDRLAFFLRDYHRKRISRKSLEDSFKKLWGKNELYPGFWKAIDGLSRTGVLYADVHLDNLMQDTSNKIKLYDLGYSLTQSRKNMEVISLENLIRELKRKKLI